LVRTTSGQCLLLSSDDLLSITGRKFWADNLYLRTTLAPGENREFDFPALGILPTSSTGGGKASYWTNMIFQGDGRGSTVGLAVDSKVFVQGTATRDETVCRHVWQLAKLCYVPAASVLLNAFETIAWRVDSLFTDLGGDITSPDAFCASYCRAGTEAQDAVKADLCTFQRPWTAPGSRYVKAQNATGAVLLTNCTFGDALRPFEVFDSGAIEVGVISCGANCA
jgi:hypothetical protein